MRKMTFMQSAVNYLYLEGNTHATSSPMVKFYRGFIGSYNSRKGKCNQHFERLILSDLANGLAQFGYKCELPALERNYKHFTSVADGGFTTKMNFQYFFLNFVNVQTWHIDGKKLDRYIFDCHDDARHFAGVIWEAFVKNKTKPKR